LFVLVGYSTKTWNLICGFRPGNSCLKRHTGYCFRRFVSKLVIQPTSSSNSSINRQHSFQHQLIEHASFPDAGNMEKLVVGPLLETHSNVGEQAQRTLSPFKGYAFCCFISRASS